MMVPWNCSVHCPSHRLDSPALGEATPGQQNNSRLRGFVSPSPQCNSAVFHQNHTGLCLCTALQRLSLLTAPLLFKQVKTLLQNFWESSIINHHPASLGVTEGEAASPQQIRAEEGSEHRSWARCGTPWTANTLRRSPSRHT